MGRPSILYDIELLWIKNHEVPTVYHYFKQQNNIAHSFVSDKDYDILNDKFPLSALIKVYMKAYSGFGM